MGCLFIFNIPLAVISFISLIVCLLKDFYRQSVNATLVLGIVILLIITFIAGVFAAKNRLTGWEESRDYFSGENITIKGNVYKKEYKNDKWRLYLTDVSGKGYEGNPGGVIVFTNREYEMGNELLISGIPMELMRAENEGGFDYEKYLGYQGIYAGFYDPEIRVENDYCNWVLEFFFRLRTGISSFFADNLPGEEGGLLSAMVLGEKTALDEDAKDIFQRAGLSHILAVSGLHLSLVGMGLLGMLRKLGMALKPSSIIAGTAVVAYGLLTGNPISMLRAVGMFGCMVAADWLGRGYDMLNALSLISLFLVMDNPLIIGDASFLMSFGAVLGIIVIAAPLKDTYRDLCRRRRECIKRRDTKGYKPGIGETFISGLIFGIGIQLFTYPLILNFFYSIPVFVIIVNMIVLPLMGILIFTGLFSGLFFFSAPLLLCHIILFYYEGVGDFVSNLPFGSLNLGKPGLLNIIIYYIILFVFLFWFKKKKKDFGKISKAAFYKRRGRVLEYVKKYNPRGYAGYLLIKKYIYKKILALILVCPVLLFILSFKVPMGFHMDMLSVGQGEGIYMESEEGVKYFIDGGSTDRKNPGENIILPYFRARAIGGIDYWIITHFDEDHYNGFCEVLESGFRVKNLIIAKVMEEDEKYGKILELCKAFSVNLVPVYKGMEFGTKSLDIRVLFPDYPVKYSGKNENSLSLYISSGDFQGIFTGDLPGEGEKNILSDPSLLALIKSQDIEVLKAGHHGSNTSNTMEWLTAVKPKTVIISAGKNNRYGHPGKDTVKRLKELGISCFCTIDCGRIRVTEGDISPLIR